MYLMVYWNAKGLINRSINETKILHCTPHRFNVNNHYLEHRYQSILSGKQTDCKKLCNLDWEMIHDKETFQINR